MISFPDNTLKRDNRLSGSVTWQSPSNIALIKYWGKHGIQLPNNQSLSFTLNNSLTKSSIEYYYSKDLTDPSLIFRFEGKENQVFKKKIEKFIKSVYDFFPFLKNTHLTIDSSNTFPHSSGIASSASSMSSIALGLCSIENHIFNNLNNTSDFFRKASFISRLGSGSASRSVFGGFTIWGKTNVSEDTSDEFAVPIHDSISPEFNDLYDAILIVASGKKQVSSTMGHQLMNDHPFAVSRFLQANQNIETIFAALKSGDWDTFIRIIENEAMSLHAMMMTSNPSFMLLKPESLAILEKIKDLREQKKMKVCFTIDAGPNIHLLYPSENRNEVKRFIEGNLIEHCENNRWIDDKLGKGPVRTQNIKNEDKI